MKFFLNLMLLSLLATNLTSCNEDKTPATTEQETPQKLMLEVPLGSMIPFAGPIFYNKQTPYESVSNFISQDAYNAGIQNGQLLAEQGWIAADGRAYSPFDPKIGGLNNVLQFGWGGSDQPIPFFRVPDMNAAFVRGVSDRINPKDPNVLQRTAIHPGGNTGYDVGSYQSDAIQNHTHTEQVPVRVNDRRMGDSGSPQIFHGTTSQTGGVSNARVSSETRPVNVYVHWIIKASNQPINLQTLETVNPAVAVDAPTN